MNRWRAEDFPPGSWQRKQIEAALQPVEVPRAKDAEAVRKLASAGGRRMNRPEQELQIACVEFADYWTMPVHHGSASLWPAWLKAAKVGEFLYHVANGGARTAAEGGIFKAMGVRPGVPDLVFALPVAKNQEQASGGLYIEMKAPGRSSATTSDQDQWHRRLRAVGYEVMVADSIEEFRGAVQDYLYGAYPAFARWEGPDGAD